MSERSGEIAQATRDLIVEMDGSLPTVRQIAARSFLSPAAIYVHFPNVEAILASVRLSTLQNLIDTLRAERPQSIDEAVAPTSNWMVNNRALLVAFTADASMGASAECIELLTATLAELGEPNVDDHVIGVAVRLVAPVPMLMADLKYGAEQVEQYLRSLAGPLSVVTAPAVAVRG